MNTEPHLHHPDIAELVESWPKMWSVDVPHVGRLTCYGAPRCIVHIMDYFDGDHGFDIYLPPVSREIDLVTALRDRATCDPSPAMPAQEFDVVNFARALPWSAPPRQKSWEGFFRQLEASPSGLKPGLSSEFHVLHRHLVDLARLGTREDTLIEHELVDDAGNDTSVAPSS